MMMRGILDEHIHYKKCITAPMRSKTVQIMDILTVESSHFKRLFSISNTVSI